MSTWSDYTEKHARNVEDLEIGLGGKTVSSDEHAEAFEYVLHQKFQAQSAMRWAVRFLDEATELLRTIDL